MPETATRRRRPVATSTPAEPAPTPEPRTEGIERAQWNSRLGFILSAMGSAVGFGSIARFPMNTANNGGAAFVLLYAVIMLLVGVPLMIAEFSIGRTAQRNTVGAFKKLENNPKTAWRAPGVLYFLMAAFFLSWYSAVSGWVLRYVFVTPTGAYFDDPAAYFTSAAEGGDTLFWHFAVMGLTLAAVTGSIAKGIERLNLVLMPTLFAIIIGLAIYAATLDGGSAGYSFYLEPKWNRISLAVVTAAVGQAFFSLSLGQGAMMTYSSYLPQKESLAQSAVIISGSTLVFAITSGFMVFPMLAAFGLLGTDAAGLGLIFGPLPAAFAGMGTPVGNIVGTAFFAATFFAAFTSAVSLTEPAIAYVTEEWGVARWKSAVLVVLGIYTAGIPVAFSTNLLDLEGGALTDMSVILGGLLIALYAGWRTKKHISRERMDSGEGLKLSWYVYPMVRYVMPLVLIVLLYFNLAGTPCALSGGDSSEGLFGQVFGWNGEIFGWGGNVAGADLYGGCAGDST